MLPGERVGAAELLEFFKTLSNAALREIQGPPADASFGVKDHTGLALEDQTVVRVLDNRAWIDRRLRLRQFECHPSPDPPEIRLRPSSMNG